MDLDQVNELRKVKPCEKRFSSFRLQGVVVGRRNALDLVVIGRQRGILGRTIDHRLSHLQAIENRKRLIDVGQMRQMGGGRCDIGNSKSRFSASSCWIPKLHCWMRGVFNWGSTVNWEGAMMVWPVLAKI